MQSGEYIRERILPDAVRIACARQGIRLAAYSNDWVLQLSKGPKTVWIFGYKFDSNRAAASHMAQDKVATYDVLQAAEIPAVPHVLVRSVSKEPIHSSSLSLVFSDTEVVIKPLSGTGGRGVRRYEHIAAALESITASPEPAWAVSPYLDIVSETRLVVLGESVVLAYAKTQPQLEHGLKFYNLSHGAKAVAIADADIPPELRKLAVRSCNQLGLRLAAVDIVTTAAGERLVLEVNDGFSMEYYAAQSTEYKRCAVELYDAIVADLFA